MNETLSPERAASAFVEAHRWQRTLIQRFEGLTWMAWAAVVPGAIVTMGFVESAGFPPWALLAAWPPWLLLGYATTHALWRTASATRAQAESPSLGSYLAKTAAIVGLLLVLHFLVEPRNMAWPTALVGAGWLAVALFTRRLSAQGRRAGTVGSCAVIVGALALGLLDVPDMASMAWAAAITGTSAAAVGTYQVMSG